MTTDATVAVKEWWTANPMDYGADVLESDERARAFFEDVDERFYRMNHPLHTDEGKFDRLFPYDRYEGLPVLEVGCGLGTMAMNWARQGANLHAVDLTPQAVALSTRRFQLHDLPGQISCGDARRLPFGDDSFDYVYSWGVLHHGPEIQQSLDEIYRVLRPGGEIGVMLYNRRSLRQLYITLLEGILHCERKFLTPLEFNSRYADGATEEGNPYTWPVTVPECKNELFRRFEHIRTRLLGTELDDNFPVVFPMIGSLAPRAIKKLYARYLGWSIWITARKGVK